MNFHELLAKMQELDQPAVETSVAEEPLNDCGEMPGPMSSPMSKPDTPPPSMSLNLNAQGLDNIEELMKLIKAVNPGMDKPDSPMPSISISPMDGPSDGGMDKPMGMSPLKLGNLDAGPLKMLPDIDSDNDDMPGGEKDMDQPDDDEKKEKEDEAFGNSVADSEPKTMDPVAAYPDGNDLNKPKKSFSDKPYRGDNPMAVEANDLRAKIRAELLQRLAEAKGVK